MGNAIQFLIYLNRDICKFHVFKIKNDFWGISESKSLDFKTALVFFFLILEFYGFEILKRYIFPPTVMHVLI